MGTVAEVRTKTSTKSASSSKKPRGKTMNAKQAAGALYALVEEQFDDQQLSSREREIRYSALKESLNARDVARARS